MPPRSVWCFATASACPFWCTLHPHPMFRWTFLSALVTFPSCSFGDSGLSFPLRCWGRCVSSGPFSWSALAFAWDSLPSQLKSHLLWGAFLIAPGCPQTQF